MTKELLYNEAKALSESFHELLNLGIDMLYDNGERAAIKYFGNDCELRKELNNNCFWCVVNTNSEKGRILSKVDTALRPELVKNFNKQNGKWEYVGTFNDYTDVLGIVYPDSFMRNDNSFDKRFHYLDAKQAKETADKLLASNQLTPQQVLEKLRKEGLELIEYSLANQNELHTRLKNHCAFNVSEKHNTNFCVSNKPQETENE